MKKLLVGCLVLVVLLVGGGGWLAYQLAPAVKQMMARTEASLAKLQELDRTYPFVEPTTLDEERFAAFLDIRVALASDLQSVAEHMNEMRSGDAGVIDKFSDSFTLMADMYEVTPTRLETAGIMGPSEFSYLSRLLYVALEVPSAGPESRQFLEKFSDFKTMYDEWSRKNDSPLNAGKDDSGEKLDVRDFLGSFDPALVASAREVMNADVARTLGALVDPSLETMLMRLDDMPGAFSETPVKIDVDTGTDASSSDPTDAPSDEAGR